MAETFSISMNTLEKLITASKMLSDVMTDILEEKKREELKEKEVKWITTNAAAKLSGMTASGIRYLITTEKIRYRRNGSHYLIQEESLMKYMTKE